MATLFYLLIGAITGLAQANSISLVHTANRGGEVQPCGCAVNQIGGLNRLQAFLEKHKAKTPILFLDSGDTFFSASVIPPTRKDQELLRAKLIAASYAKMGLDAFTPGERDLAGGIDLLRELQKESGAVFLSANLVDGGGAPLFEKWKLFQKGPRKVAVTALTDPKVVESVLGVKALPPAEALAAVLPEMKASGAEALVLLSHLGLPADRDLAAGPAAEFTAILGSHSLDVLTKPVVVGKVQILQPQNEGQQVGLLELKPAAGAFKLVDLGKEYEAPNASFLLMEAYKAKVRDLALAESETVAPPSSDRPFVASSAYCKNCHPKQTEWWEKTKHASAYLVLFAKNQHFDPECIACHSVGFRQPGGFARIAEPLTLDPPVKRGKDQLPFVEEMMKTVFKKDSGKGPLDSRVQPARYAKLKKAYHAEIGKLEAEGKLKALYIGVQCEHCHGNRHGHPNPEVPTVKRVVEASCKQCHVPPHDNKFNFAKKVKIVGCPLSQKL